LKTSLPPPARRCWASAASTRAHGFLADWERKVVRLERELREGSYRLGAYFYFTITEPKERVVAAAPFRDRVLARLSASLFPSASSVVHHALVRVIEPCFGCVDKRSVPNGIKLRALLDN